MFLKTISWVLLLTFSSSRIVFADDISSTNIGKALDILNRDESNTFAPAYIRYQEALHQELVQIKQDAEDLSNMPLPSLAADDAIEDDLAPQEEPVDLQGPSGGSGDLYAPFAMPSLTPQETADLISQTHGLIDDGILIDYLNESVIYKARADMLSRGIAIAREGLSVADAGVEDAAEKVSSKEAEIEDVFNGISLMQEASELISDALKKFSGESMTASDELARAQDSLEEARREDIDLRNILSGLGSALESKRAELHGAILELEFADMDFENSVSLIKQNLGADFDIYASAYQKTAGPGGRVTSVIFNDKRSELELLISQAIGQVSENETACLGDLDLRAEEAINKVYEDESLSLAQLDGLCEERVNEIIASRDEGLADIERQRTAAIDEANRQFGTLYASVSAQASYWGSRKAALYQSGQIEAYIYAAAMADVYSNQAYSVWIQWNSQIASIDQQCDDAAAQLEGDAAAAINNVPAEKEAATEEIASQREALLKEIAAAALEQEERIYAERDNALAEIERQRSEAFSTIQAEESLILAAWQEHYMIDDLETIIAGKEQEAAAAEKVYKESGASYGLFLENTLKPAETSYNKALSIYNEALDNISLNETALTVNESNVVSLYEQSALLDLELSGLTDSLAEKTSYRDNVAGLLDDMLDAEKLLMIRTAEMADYYERLLARKESPEASAENGDISAGGSPAISEDALSDQSSAGDIISELLRPESSDPAFPDLSCAAEERPLFAAPSGQIPSDPVLIAPEEYARVEVETDTTEEGLVIRGREVPEPGFSAAMKAPISDQALLGTFESLFDRTATEGGIDMFNLIMLMPPLPDIKLIDASKEVEDYYLAEDGVLYHIVDERAVSAVTEGKAYIFNADGGIDRILLQNGNELLDYLYDHAGNLVSINFSDARTSVEDARDSASNAIMEKFSSYRSGLDEQKKALEDEVALKYSECLYSIEERAEVLKGGVAKEYSARMSALESEKARMDALLRYLERKERAFEGLLIDNRIYADDAIAADMDSVRAAISSMGRSIENAALDRDEALQVVDDERAKAVSALERQRDDALADINAKIEGITNSLITSEDAAMTKLSEGVDDAFSAIKMQEDLGLIRYHFRESLGREPTYDEIVFCAENGYTAKESLTSSVFKEELAAKEAFKDRVIENIRVALGTDRFGSLTQEEKAAILSYLDGQSLHFGMSALVPLSGALRAQDIVVDEGGLLTELILSEIAAGNLDHSENAPLKISMDAMIVVAEANGVELSGFSVTMDELETALKDGVKSVIALINRDHYVTILSIDNDTVAYLDPSMGVTGANVAMPKDEFMDKFSGNVIAKAGTIDSSKLLSKENLMAAKGAGFFDWIGKVFDWVGDLFSDIFEAIGNFVANIVSSIADGINRAIEVVVDVVKNIAMIPVNFVKDIAAGNWTDALWTVGSLIPGVGAIKSAIEGDWVSAGIQAGAFLLGAAIPTIGSEACGAIGNAVRDFAGSIIAPITDVISPFFSGISSVVESIAGSVGQACKPIADLTSNIVSSILSSPIGQSVSGAAGVINDLVVTPAITTGILEGAKVTLTDLGLSSTIADIGGAALSSYAGAYMSGNGAVAIPMTLGSAAYQSFKEIGAAFDFDETITSALGQVGGSFVTTSVINSGLSDTVNNTALDPSDLMTDASPYDLESPEFALIDSIDGTITGLELMDRASELDLGPGSYYDTSTGRDTRTYAIMSGNGSLIENVGYDLGWDAGMYAAYLFGDDIAYSGAFWGKEILQIKNEYLRRRSLGESTLNSLPPVGLIGEELIYQVAGSAIDYKVEPNSEWLGYINQESSIASLNGINNEEPEGTPPSYEMWSKECFTPIPMFEGNNVRFDVGTWLIDELFGINVVTNEAKEKYLAYAERINEGVRINGITCLAYSGSWNPMIKNLKYATEENRNVTALVGIGGVSFRGGWFPESIENPNLKVVVNIWGDKDSFYNGRLGLLKLVGPNKFNGVSAYNVMILGVEHGGYLDTADNLDIRNSKITNFILNLTQEAAQGEEYVRMFLLNEGDSVVFNQEMNTFIVDPNKFD